MTTPAGSKNPPADQPGNGPPTRTGRFRRPPGGGRYGGMGRGRLAPDTARAGGGGRGRPGGAVTEKRSGAADVRQKAQWPLLSRKGH
ncbi:hypothetical protein FDA94_33585 [Herbidospora galbida]|uniref:Uncharacterized protein n=1 Tax=Herbidospora galbida TaxID=2575442 RepID=A0A4U3LZC1_9ACTN|nr:hypothetical protein FDA94_33585 [Herbidospora galbida]